MERAIIRSILQLFRIVGSQHVGKCVENFQIWPNLTHMRSYTQ